MSKALFHKTFSMLFENAQKASETNDGNTRPTLPCRNVLLTVLELINGSLLNAVLSSSAYIEGRLWVTVSQ